MESFRCHDHILAKAGNTAVSIEVLGFHARGRGFPALEFVFSVISTHITYFHTQITFEVEDVSRPAADYPLLKGVNRAPTSPPLPPGGLEENSSLRGLVQESLLRFAGIETDYLFQ